MTLLKPAIEPIPSRTGQLATWLPRIAVALAFLTIGYSKFRDPMWVIATTMFGAAVAWLTALHAPQNAPIPGALLVILVAIGIGEYNRRLA